MSTKTKPTTQPEYGDAYKLVQSLYWASPGRSWQRLNGALHDTLNAAITAHLSFEPEDFNAICRDFNGGYWMGNSEGSFCGERYYMLAVKVGHTPACISFENYAGRPAALWAEKVKTPARLCIGSEFTWEGQTVKVSNMMAEYFTACTYKSVKENPNGSAYLGNEDGRRPIIEKKSAPDGGLLVHFGKSAPELYGERPDKIYKIKYTELAEKRKAHDSIRKTVLAEINSADSLAALEILQAKYAAIPRSTYRHFDIDDFGKAYTDRAETIREALGAAERETEDRRINAERYAKLDRWVAGENIPTDYYWRNFPVRLRVNGKWVETSTGQRVIAESCSQAMPIVLKRRAKLTLAEPIKIDLHELHGMSREGVTVGCTFVAWSEVERLDGILNQFWQREA